MQWVRSIGGVVVAGSVTLSLFAGGPLLALIGAEIPTFVYEEMDEREAVYWEEGLRGTAAFAELELESEETDAEEPEVEREEDENADEAEVDHDGAEDAAGEAAAGDEGEEGEGDAAVADDAGAEERRTTRRKRRRRGHRCVEDPIPEIERLDRGQWVIQRSLVKHYMGSIQRINSLGWSRTHDDENGKPDGMRLGGIRCNNDLHRAGIRSGDIVHTVNGHNVRNIVQAMLVYTRVRRDPTVRVVITRRGQRRTLTYRIQG